MEKITKYAYAKINWSLFITGIRENGYHELDMLMQEVDLHDDIELEKADRTELIVNGVPSDDRSNMVLKALIALSCEGGKELPVRISLTKRIPSKAGLGGGSSDCARTLIGINELYDLDIPVKRMEEIAVKLGADVPFFLKGGLCRVRGIGEKADEVKNAASFPIVIKHVGDGLSTPEVYKMSDLLGLEMGGNTDEVLKGILTRDMEKVKKSSANALEKAAFTLDGNIPEAIRKLYEEGALYARMSGSGSAVYGVFENESAAQKAAAAIPGSILTFTRA